jgi:DNA-binding NarL/FixJ family response regulator
LASRHQAGEGTGNYVSSLLHKLGFSRRTEAAVYAAEMRKDSR